MTLFRDIKCIFEPCHYLYTDIADGLWPIWHVIVRKNTDCKFVTTRVTALQTIWTSTILIYYIGRVVSENVGNLKSRRKTAHVGNNTAVLRACWVLLSQYSTRRAVPKSRFSFRSMTTSPNRELPLKFYQRTTISALSEIE